MMSRKTQTTPLSSIGEDNLIRRIAEWVRPPDSSKMKKPAWAAMEILAAIGDDTGIVRSAPGAPPMAVTTDMLVEGVHFLPGHPPFELGRKSAAVNLSDLAAVGAWPAWVVVSLGLPPSLPVEWIESFYKGMNRMLARYGCLCIGGDCVRSEKIVINIAAAGNCSPTSQIPLRSRLKPGQNVYVTGTLGDSGAGLRLLQNPRRMKNLSSSQLKDANYLIARHQCPTPRIEAGIAITKACPDAALMDLSDGLASDLPRMAVLASCAIDIHTHRLPLSPQLKRLASIIKTSPIALAASAGEDYELVFATVVPVEQWKRQVSRSASGRPLRITKIGAVVPFDSRKNDKSIRFIDAYNQEIPEEAMRFHHF